MRTVFLSYRRDDTQYITGFIYQHLVAPTGFGPDSVFMDIDSIPPGVDFREVIEEHVTQCRFFLAVIGKQWATVRDAEGQLRLSNPNDFVRLEVEAALRRDIPLVPVLVDGAKMPKKEELPESLHPLVFKNATTIRPGKWFGPDVEVLVAGLRRAEHWKSRTAAEPSRPPVATSLSTPATESEPRSVNGRGANGPTDTRRSRVVGKWSAHSWGVIVVAMVALTTCLLAVGGVAVLRNWEKPSPASQSTPATQEEKTAPQTDAQRYDKLMRSAVWLEGQKKGASGFTTRGSGCLIQSGPDKLVLTASSAVDGADTIVVAFPRLKLDGKEWERDPTVYRERGWQVPAEVVRRDKKLDLALLRLQALPTSAVPLKLVGERPRVGDRCFTIGNRAPDGEALTADLWSFQAGVISQLEGRRTLGQSGQFFETWVIHSSIVLNRGDWGCPLLNERDELLGVNSLGFDENVLSGLHAE